MSMAAIAVVATPLVIGGINAAVQKNKANKMESDILAQQGVVDDALAARQDLDEAVYDPGDDIRAMKSMVSNPMANLSVATQAAEIKMEQTDIALANTLDTLAATGSSAGGATALARAAMQSKQNVAADIESQEAQNEKLKAQGEQQVQQQLLSIEQSAIAGSTQAANIKLQMQEARDQAGIDRAYGELDALRSRQLGLEDAAAASLMAGIQGTTSAATAGMGPDGALTNAFA
tara:strand:- start:12058 stop:12756 length:699 start_codon:yes stop_codon:yes gene_type:complete